MTRYLSASRTTTSNPWGGVKLAFFHEGDNTHVMRYRMIDGRALVISIAVAVLCACGDDGTTRDGGVTARCTPQTGIAQDDVEFATYATGFQSPILVLAPAEDPRLFVVEQRGAVHIWEDGETLSPPFMFLNGLTEVDAEGDEQGLLGMAFHPNFATNGKFYLSMTARAGYLGAAKDGDTLVAEYTVSSNPNLANNTGRRIFTTDQPRTNHNGGMISFGKDGFLYIAIGDGGKQGDPDNNAQNTTRFLGKILRIDVDTGDPYGIPATNPFAGSANGPGDDRPEVYAYGFRNPWRMSFDAVTGDLYIGDVGQNRREEVSVFPVDTTPPLNFGWNIMEGQECFNPDDPQSPKPLDQCDQGSLTPSLYDLEHGDGACSVIGGVVYRGSCFPDLQGTYFVSDFCTGIVDSFRLNEAKNGILELTTNIDRLERPTSFGEDGFGEVYAVERGGEIKRMVKAR